MKKISGLSNLKPRLFWQISLAFAALTFLLGGGMVLIWNLAWQQSGTSLTDGSFMMRGCLNDLEDFYAEFGNWNGVENTLSSRSCKRGWMPDRHNEEVLLLADETGLIVASRGGAHTGRFFTETERGQAISVLSNDRLVGLLYSSQAANWGRKFFGGLLGMGSLLIIITLMIGLIISQRISSPIANLTRASQALAAGDLSARVPVSGRGETRNLAIAFNQMAGQVEQTILTLRRFISDAAHEMNSPLMALHTNLELAPQNEAVRQALLQTQRLEQLAASLLDLSRIEGHTTHETFSIIHLSELIQEMSEMAASRAEQKGLEFILTLPERPVMVHGDQAQLRRTIANLLDNAIKFTPEPGRVTLTLDLKTPDVLIIVEDTGIGIPPDDLPRLFDRFHRGRNTHDYPGNGLGLAIVKAIVEDHGGQIDIESLPTGTRVTLRLPISGNGSC